MRVFTSQQEGDRALASWDGPIATVVLLDGSFSIGAKARRYRALFTRIFKQGTRQVKKPVLSQDLTLLGRSFLRETLPQRLDDPNGVISLAKGLGEIGAGLNSLGMTAKSTPGEHPTRFAIDRSGEQEHLLGGEPR